MTLRSGVAARTRSSAALKTLYRLTDVESATTNSPASAPTSRAILSPTRCGRSIQPALFQLPICPTAPLVADHVSHACGRILGNGPASFRRDR